MNQCFLWLTIGNESGSAGYDGWIDDVKIYSYARTAEDVAQEYFDVTGIRSCIYDYDNPDFVLDFDDNCIIDLADFAVFAQSWLSTGLYPAP